MGKGPRSITPAKPALVEETLDEEKLAGIIALAAISRTPISIKVVPMIKAFI